MSEIKFLDQYVTNFIDSLGKYASDVRLQSLAFKEVNDGCWESLERCLPLLVHLQTLNFESLRTANSLEYMYNEATTASPLVQALRRNGCLLSFHINSRCNDGRTRWLLRHAYDCRMIEACV